jgi:hypothetical protein
LAAEYLCIDVSLFRSHYASFGCIYCGLSKLKFLQLSRAPLRMVNSPAKLFKAILTVKWFSIEGKHRHPQWKTTYLNARPPVGISGKNYCGYNKIGERITPDLVISGIVDCKQRIRHVLSPVI